MPRLSMFSQQAMNRFPAPSFVRKIDQSLSRTLISAILTPWQDAALRFASDIKSRFPSGLDPMQPDQFFLHPSLPSVGDGHALTYMNTIEDFFTAMPTRAAAGRILAGFNNLLLSFTPQYLAQTTEITPTIPGHLWVKASGAVRRTTVAVPTLRIHGMTPEGMAVQESLRWIAGEDTLKTMWRYERVLRIEPENWPSGCLVEVLNLPLNQPRRLDFPHVTSEGEEMPMRLTLQDRKAFLQGMRNEDSVDEPWGFHCTVNDLQPVSMTTRALTVSDDGLGWIDYSMPSISTESEQSAFFLWHFTWAFSGETVLLQPRVAVVKPLQVVIRITSPSGVVSSSIHTDFNEVPLLLDEEGVWTIRTTAKYSDTDSRIRESAVQVHRESPSIFNSDIVGEALAFDSDGTLWVFDGEDLTEAVLFWDVTCQGPDGQYMLRHPYEVIS